jgi:hypothetical protein
LPTLKAEVRQPRDGAAAEADAVKARRAHSCGEEAERAQLELRREAGEAFASLVERWKALAACLSDRSALADGASELLEAVSPFRREARERREAATVFAVVPVPTSFATFLDELLEAALGERTDIEAEHRIVDDMNARRRDIAKRDPGGTTDLPPIAKPVIQPRTLDELVPDLRGTVRTASITGTPIRRR